MTNLMAHCDTNRVTEAEVMAVPEPVWTDTWHPVSHASVINSVSTVLDEIGIQTVSREYSLNKNGSKMFGVMNLDIGNGMMGYSLGLRNGIAKNMGLGITAGTNVFVCDNMCFSGDFLTFGRHTSGMGYDRVLEMVREGLDGIQVKMMEMHSWHKGLLGYYVKRAEFKAMTFDMMTKGVFSPGQLGNYLEAFEIEKKIKHPNVGPGRNLSGAGHLFAVHGAATRIMKGWNLLRVADATKALNGVCDDYLAARAA